MKHKSWLGLALVPMLGAPVCAQDISFSGDLRFGYSHLEREKADGTKVDESQLRLRARAGAQWDISDVYSVRGRIAGTFNNDDYSGEFRFYQALPEGEPSIDDGDMTFDELFVRARYGDWEHRLGRFQHGNLLAVLASKSMSRTNSNSWNVTWTDGLHSRYRAQNGWDYNFVIERSVSDGPTLVRRAPLNYESSRNRASYYASIDKSEPDGLFLQRSIDVTVIPAALYYNGVAAGAKTDYVAFSGRLALQWDFLRQSKLVLGAEAGYAPETPRNAAMNLPGNGDTGGESWQASLNVMDIAPGHSVGVVYGETDAGWLLSTDFVNNQSLKELRYHWIVMPGHTVQFRLREREDLIRKSNAVRRSSELDGFLRYTITL